MACHIRSSFASHKLKSSISSSNFFPVTSIPFHRNPNLHFPSATRRILKCISSTSVSSSSATTSFTWDDVFRIAKTKSHSSDLQGFIDKVKTCNRSYEEERHHFFPFVMEDQIVGYVHTGFADHLRRFQDVFTFFKEKYSGSPLDVGMTLNEKLKSPEERTKAVGDVVKILGENLIPGIRNELYPVSSSFGMPVFFSLERAAAPYFGIKAYGVHMNGYVEKDGEKYLWIGKRSETKPTFPGMLDHLVAGGLPHGIPCGENLIKECEEEAGIPWSISNKAIPVGAVSYNDIDGFRYKRDVLFCYDLKLPQDFVPINQDAEVGSFKLMAVSDVGNVISRTQFFKANCNLVIIDFLFRHGYIMPEETGYLKLLQSLRSPNCS